MAQLESLAGVDLTTVNTEYPVLATGVYPFNIGSVKVEPTKKNPANKMLVIELVLKADATDKDGKFVAAGYKLTHRIGVTASGDRTNEMVARDIARLQEAALGRRVPLEEFDTDMLLNQEVIGKTSIKPAEGDYPESTRLSSFVAKATA